MTAIFTTAIFAGAFLLFLIEPLVAKMLLPYYGGAPAVWNTCMVFFQIVLLLGYGYSHLLTKWLGFRSQIIVHFIIVVLTFLVLPIGFDDSASPPSDVEPAFWLLRVLLVRVGLAFFVIASISPLLQRWFSYSNLPEADDPYFLYAASNTGSFLALLSYPLLIERLWGTSDLSVIWRYGFISSAALVVLCVVKVGNSRMSRRIPANGESISEENIVSVPLPLKTAFFWVFSAFVPSALMLAVTNHITTNIAAVPLLWVLPLSLYLLTFVIVFARKQRVPHKLVLRVLPFLLLPLAPTLFISSRFELILIPVHLLMFFIAALACHGELALFRPSKSRLTEYYFLMSLGGALGGVFVAIISPMVFNKIIEYPISLFLALLVMTKFSFARGERKKQICDFILAMALVLIIISVASGSNIFSVKDGSIVKFMLIFGPSALIVFSLKEMPWRFALAYGVLLTALGVTGSADNENQFYQSRNFFGEKRITENKEKTIRYLFHGTTLHGSQFLDDAKQREPLSYFHRKGPVGDIFKAISKNDSNMTIAVIGLGTGSIAAYIGEGSHITFFEIDGDIKDIATNERYFSYLRNMEGDYEIIMGDGRIELNKVPDGKYDMIIIDAFSSDSIPVHLLTQEAVALYSSKLKDDGIIAFHISNKFIDLRPIIGNHAKLVRMKSVVKFDGKPSDGDDREKLPSHYAVLGKNQSRVVEALLKDSGWEPLDSNSSTPPWTDKYSNIISLLKLKDPSIWSFQDNN